MNMRANYTEYFYPFYGSKAFPFKNLKEALEVIGGLSDTKKMDCPSYGIPADLCITGSKLRSVKGSTCESCYAYFKGMYRFDNVRDAQFRRYETLQNEDREKWISAFVYIINKRNEKYFRWHDSGDLQSVDHLKRIAEIAILTPNCKHWLPTREAKIVKEFLDNYECPQNLCIRISDTMIDAKKPVSYLIGKTQFSGVQSKGKAFDKDTCNSKKHIGGYKYNKRTKEYKADFGYCTGFTESGKYVECRKCWDKNTFKVNYPIH
tara:strand:- start:3054 stop:3842 length:789 start_codon:yes stop_codon:yes gene_type:complete